MSIAYNSFLFFRFFFFLRTDYQLFYVSAIYVQVKTINCLWLNSDSLRILILLLINECHSCSRWLKS